MKHHCFGLVKWYIYSYGTYIHTVHIHMVHISKINNIMYKLLIPFYNTSKWLGGNRVAGINQCLWRNLRTPGKLGIAQSSPLTFICERLSRPNSGERLSKCVGFKCKREREFDHTELLPVSKTCLVFDFKFVIKFPMSASMNNPHELQPKFKSPLIQIWEIDYFNLKQSINIHIQHLFCAIMLSIEMTSSTVGKLV